MDKPEIVLQLEKELNTTFKQVDVKKIIEGKIKKTAEYLLDENQNITGFCIALLELIQIPDILQKYFQSAPAKEYLTHLNFYNNKITDISAIKDLKNLTKIEFSYNQISDISPLKDLKNLTKIRFWNNQITDISFIKDLKNLTQINFCWNNITDIAAIKDLKNLTKIEFSNNQITDTSAIADLIKKNRCYTDFHFNPLSDKSRKILSPNKPDIIIKIEKDFNRTFQQFKVNLITEIWGIKYGYSMDELQNITGLCITVIDKISETLQNYLQSYEAQEYLTHLNLQGWQLTLKYSPLVGQKTDKNKVESMSDFLCPKL